MVTNKLKELEETRAKLARLEAAAQAELAKELSTLPAKYGFSTPEAFLSAVRAASGTRPRRGRPPKSAFGAAAVAATGRKPRATITDETRAQVKKLVKDGKTGAEIAAKLDISLPSVQNIKKALGLVQKR